MQFRFLLRWAIPAVVVLFSACRSPAPAPRIPVQPPVVSAAPTPAPPPVAAPVAPVVVPDSTPAPAAPPLPLPLPDAATRVRAMELLRQGREMARARNPRAAARLYEEAGQLLPPFRDWAHVLAATAFAKVGDTAEVRRSLERLAPGSAREWGWRVHARVLQERGELAAAIQVAEQAARTAHSRVASDAWADAGELHARGGDRNSALAAFRQAMAAAPGSTGALRAARAASEMEGLTARDRLLVGRTLLQHGGTERGIAGLDAFLASGQGDRDERARVHLEAGRTLFLQRRYTAAEPHLRAAAPVLAEASFLLGRVQYRQDRTDAARETFLATARRFSRDSAAAEALYTLGDLAQDAGRAADAREHYRQAIATGVHTVSAADAAVRLAGLAVHSGNSATAISDLDAYLDGRPRDAMTGAALYWAGRAHLLAGREEAARQRFQEALAADPISYYGVLAAGRLGQTLEGVQLASSPVIEPRTEAEAAETFFRIDLLRDLGLREEADFELARLRAGMADNPEALYLVAEGMMRRGQPIAAALLGREIYQKRGRWDDRLLRIVYQFPYREAVLREASRNGLDPYVVAGLIRQESFFNPVAISSAGAIGLMQVMPETGRGLARRVGIAGFTPSMLRQPEINVRLGTLFLADQMRRWNGRRADVFSAYNAGPGRVVRWRNFPEHRDEDLFVERIPFAETRDYVKKVRLHTEIYRRLYGEETTETPAR